jgi:hypothetical protein
LQFANKRPGNAPRKFPAMRKTMEPRLSRQNLLCRSDKCDADNLK